MIYIFVSVPFVTSLLILYVADRFFRPKATYLELHNSYVNKQRGADLKEIEEYKSQADNFLSKELKRKERISIWKKICYPVKVLYKNKNKVNN